MKAGLSGENGPSVRLPTYQGRPSKTAFLADPTLCSKYLGNEAQDRRGILHLKSPVDHGVVVRALEIALPLQVNVRLD